MKHVARCRRGFVGLGILLLVWGGNPFRAQANPSGGSVVGGNANATISGEGTSLTTINQTAPSALINWQSFNIGAGETVNFNQPSATSVTWNYINDPNNPSASSINGNINAPGYVILQNPNGFIVDGQASITAHGLIMTTASTPALNLSSGGPWSFNTPPPTAKIINYGQINITSGGQAYLIANDIENNGTISAPGGKIGLYAGQTVLVSMSPDGRGLSAQATIPQGLVDNNGNLTADAGSIALQAQTVNQNGVIQANSAQNVNGTIELVAGSQGSLNLGASSTISANGDPTATTTPSPGGFVVLKSDKTFAVAPGSMVSVSGAAGGQNGILEIFDPGASTSPIQPTGNYFAALFNPYDLTLSSSTANTSTANPTLGLGDLSAYSQIDLQALDNIALSSAWNLPNSSSPATLSLTAGNNVTLNNSISAGNNWDINLTAGTAYSGTTKPDSGYGIYLNGGAYIQAVNGDINLNAANEVIVGSGAIRTIGGGNIDVTAEYGNVNSGTSVNGFSYLAKPPYYTPFLVSSTGTINYNQCNLGGISTAAGGNVTINAGGDVISSPTTTVAAGDPGTGAFGPEAGNVTINAGGNVYGNYIVMNGVGTINAGQNIGTAANNVALSLAKGSWNLNAGWDPVSQTVQSGLGDIFLQEVRNPNGVFNDTPVSKVNSSPSAGNHLFDYDPQASVSLTAGNGVYLTGNELPRLSDETGSGVPLLLPPILIINAGFGGVNLQQPTATDGSGNDITLKNLDITLFPSPYQNLEITTTDGGSLNGNGNTLLMSDSGRTQWFNTALGGYFGPEPFGADDHASVPLLLNNDEPATINLAGSMLNLILQTDKATQINIAGDMDGCSFYGENLQATGPASITSITVGGQIYNAGSFTSITLDQPLPTLPAADTPLTPPTGASLSSWYLPLLLALNPANTQSILFPGLDVGSLVYNPKTMTLTAIGPMSADLLQVLETQTLTVPRYNSLGIAVGTDTINWMPSGSANASLISSLYTSSQSASSWSSIQGAPPAYVVGGMGYFNVTAGSIDLGNSGGFLSVFDEGDSSSKLTFQGSYSFLAPYVTSGATINVTVLDPQQTVNGLPEPSLYMPASTIATLGGGDVNVSAPNGSMDLGSSELLPFENQIMNASKIGLGIYTTAGGNVTVTALGTINIDSSRIATFDGGDIFIESYTGDVNAGSGGTVSIPINYFSPSYSRPELEQIPANGIVAGTLTAATTIPPGAATLPGNITVITPQGSIYADLGGISQAAFGEILTADTATSTIGLFAGTPLNFNNDWYSEDNNWNAKPPLYIGNIELGTSGVIGVNVTAKATGTITGLIISQQNADVTAAESFTGTLLSGGKANVSSGGAISGTIVALGGLSTSGGGNLMANVLSTSVNGGAGTLATSSSASSASQSATAQTSTENQQQVASNTEPEKKKKKKEELVRTVGRVTVILPKAS